MTRVVIAALVTALELIACSQADRTAPDELTSTPVSHQTIAPSSEINPRLLRRFQPIKTPAPPTTPADVAKLALGRRLFFETRLSMDGDLSCNSCHSLDHYGADSVSLSKGRGGAHGSRNAPTVFNAAGQFVQFWDGRAESVEEQAKGPIENPIEMGLPAAQVVERLGASDSYRTQFAAAFPEDGRPVSMDHVGDAIGAFERTLFLRSRWDLYLEGDRTALTAAEKNGLRVFLNSGCMVCHTGPYLGGSMFERVGVVEPWPTTTDVGRMAVTGAPADRMMFKVPTLRNIGKTAPYFHDGSVPDLSTAVQMMGRHQLGIDLSPGETQSIVVWLNALTADLPRDLTSGTSDGGAAASIAPRAAARESCGASPLPLCPLQAWMRSNAMPAMRDRDPARIERVFAESAKFAPAAYAEWAKWSIAGAEAARRGDMDAAQSACSGCHQAYRASYRAELRERPLL